MNQQLKCINGDQSSFYTVLRARVDDYILDKQSSKYANSSMVFKTGLYITATVLLYGLILADLFPLYVQLLLAITMGFTMEIVGFNICKDALQGADYETGSAECRERRGKYVER